MKIINVKGIHEIIIEDVSLRVVGELHSSLQKLGYILDRDYNITTMPMSSRASVFSNRISIYMRIAFNSNKLLEDPRIKELLLEYII